MKVAFRLDESLFEDFGNDDEFVSLEFDDDFSDHDIEDVLPGPAEGTDTGVSSELIALINDEWEAIEGYNNAIATLRAVSAHNPFYEDAIKVLEEISAEENVHVGQLQEVLRRISPNAAEIQKGTKEAISQLGLVNGVLPVQSWNEQPATINNSVCTTNDETCTLNDIDDEM